MVLVAQLAEHWIVVPTVVSSNLTKHPCIYCFVRTRVDPQSARVFYGFVAELVDAPA